jgi:hypothetical protein
MSEKGACYLKILAIEIQDLIEDVVLRMDTQEARLRQGGITDYVYRENVALLESERRALGRFLEELAGMDAGSFRGVSELEREIERLFKVFLEEHGFPHAVEEFVTRKMRKVLRYCQTE